MEKLKLVQKPKNGKVPAKVSKSRSVKKDDDLIDLFPHSQYFQVHFQHIHENAHDLQNELAQLKNYVAKVDEKLERLIALLDRSPEREL